MSFLNKFPSFTVIFRNISNTSIRFPFAMLSVLSATICGLILSETDNFNFDSEELVFKLLLFSLLGIPLFIALKMFTEKRNWKFLKSLQFQALGFVLLLIYYFLIPLDIDMQDKYLIQYGLFFVFCLFLNAIIPYLSGKKFQGFWQYNKSLFLGILISGLYSNVMGLGLLIALSAMDHLFNMDIDSKRYMQIWIIIGILFNSIVFMSKIPDDFDSLENDYSYPKGLKIFIQYILLPLVGLYLLILYSYEAKIIFEWNWPVGWVSNLVLWYSVVSIFSLLLLYPLRELKENKWIQVFSKWFFRALIPLVVMLFLAIIERITTYGITEPRYFVFAMAIGLAVVVLYFVISKSKDIRIIPIIIALLAFISALGPWSASSVSLSSQQNRLESLLVTSNLFVDSKLVTPDETPDFDSRKEMSSIVTYLFVTHGIESFDTWLDETSLTDFKLKLENEKLDSNYSSYNYQNNSEEICSILGFEYESRWSTEGSFGYFHLEINESIPIEISEYDYFYQFPNNFPENTPYKFSTDSDDCFIKIDKDNAIIEFYRGDSSSSSDDLVEINLTDTLHILNGLNKPDDFDPSVLSFNLVGKKYEAKIVFSRVNGDTKEGEQLSISSFDAVLLLKKK